MPSTPDIVFIVLDTQRADRLGCYGYENAKTPNFDRFARQCALFQRAISPAQWTIPSHASFFTGLYPTAHQVTQSNQSLSREEPQLAEWLRRGGYETVGFCNNPLVSVLDNGFKRGFDNFYVYGGAAPNPWGRFATLPSWARTGLTAATSAFRRFADPIQNFFGQSELAFRLSINALFTPLWSRFARFKGQNERSVKHVNRFLQERDQQTDEQKPLFLFLNVMETHLPFGPPQAFIDEAAPYMREDATARREMQRWNREAYRWAAPLAEPMAEMEHRVLNDLYDAEVAYQDSFFADLLTYLEKRSETRDTLTIIVSDHGDGLGEHDMVGHAFNAYQELVHVPLMIHWPKKLQGGSKIDAPVSTRRVFHTMLDAAQIDWQEDESAPSLSLMETIEGDDPENETAYSEIFPPLNFVSALQHRRPELIEQFRCTSLRRAIVQQDWKLIQVAEQPDELFDVIRDPDEVEDLLEVVSAETQTASQALDLQLNHFTKKVESQRDGLTAGETFDLEDERIREQLRGLGYIE